MKTVVVFSGAGLSAESGVPTFRDADGLWENHHVQDVASQDGWRRDPQLVLNFYEQRFIGVRACEPNDAHKALARLQEKYNVVNITQNIDDLLERAGCTDVRHLHGSLFKRKCERHKSIMRGGGKFNCNYETVQDQPVRLGDTCQDCGKQVRPSVVWFGEAVDMDYDGIRELVREVKYNDGVFICVGTSAQVHPAAALIPLFCQVPKKYIIDPKPTKIGDYTLLTGKAGEILPNLVDELLDQV